MLMINLAAPTKGDKVALAAMSRDEQKSLYEDAILKSSTQSGCKVSKEEIKILAFLLSAYE